MRSAKPNQTISKEISVFLELAKAFSGQKDIFTLLKLVKDETTKLMDADRASIFLIDKDTEEIWSLMADGVNVIRFPISKGIVGSVIQKNETLNIPDAPNDDRFYSEIDKKTGYETKNILCVPMRNRFGEAVGAIEVLNKSSGAFSEYDESLLMILGTQASVAIENVEMLEDFKESLKQVELLNKIQRESNYYVDINSVFKMVLIEVSQSLKGEYAAIALRERDEDVVFSCFVSPNQFQTIYAGDKKMAEWAHDHPEFEEVFSKFNERIKILEKKDILNHPGGVIAAIKDQASLLGYMEIGKIAEDERLFSKRTIDFLRVICGQAVSFVANKKLVEEKNRSEKMAVVGNMVSVIVHDIKNPLAGISGYAQMIKRKSENEKIKGFVDVMLNELTRLEQMNNELLTFVRGEQISLEISEIEISEFIEGIRQIIEADFKENGIELKTTVECAGRVSMDVNRMKRVFVNIGNNSRDAMPEGGTFAISATKTEDDKTVSFELEDTGTGMSPEVRAKLFEPFFTKGKENGTGLGMAITKNIVEKHDGKIKVESEQGKGTKFIISLPL